MGVELGQQPLTARTDPMSVGELQPFPQCVPRNLAPALLLEQVALLSSQAASVAALNVPAALAAAARGPGEGGLQILVVAAHLDPGPDARRRGFDVCQRLALFSSQGGQGHVSD